jgi:hypothetical protein
MKLIVIDGGPASGKNTLGTLLLERFRKHGNKVILLDLDTYVEQLDPRYAWINTQRGDDDRSRARRKYIRDVQEYLGDDFIVIAIGERFLTSNDFSAFLSKLQITCRSYLYHLSVPLSLRRQRLHNRGPHSLIDLDKDQKDRDEVKTWPGYVYTNVNAPEEDARCLYELIQNEVGRIS